MKIDLPLHIVVQKPPAGLYYGLQKGSGSKYETVQIQRSNSQDLHFYFSIDIKGDRQKDTMPGFIGAFVQGPPAERFIYLDIGSLAGQANAISGRLKIPLVGISWEDVDELKANPELVLETTVPGTGKKGGPNFATVKPFEGWKVAKSGS